jgi:RNA polymerase sigma-70 factor (ECF subfamily)
MQMDRHRDLFWELLEAEHPRFRAFCRRLAGDRNRGDDLCQDSLVAALRRFDTLRDKSLFRAWLYRIVVNRYRNSRRSWRRWLRLTESNHGNGSGPDPGAHHDAKRTLELAMRSLTPDERALISLHELEGWSVRDLVALTGRSESALKVRLFRIRRCMRDELLRRAARMEAVRKANTAERKERLWIVKSPGVD